MRCFSTIFKYQVFITFTSISPVFLVPGDIYISQKCSYKITHTLVQQCCIPTSPQNLKLYTSFAQVSQRTLLLRYFSFIMYATTWKSAPERITSAVTSFMKWKYMIYVRLQEKQLSPHMLQTEIAHIIKQAYILSYIHETKHKTSY